MLSTLSKAYIAFAVIGAVSAVVYVVGVGGDHMGGALLVTLFVAGLAFAAATSLRPIADTDLETPVPDDAPPPAMHPAADPGPAADKSIFPFAAAAGLTLLGIGATTDVGIVVFGAGVVGLGLAGWLATSWREHPLWTRRLAGRVGDRAVGPFGYPVIALLVGASVAFSLSRLYLAIDKNAATVVSVILATLVLAGATILAAGKNVGRRLTTTFAAVAMLAMVGSGVAGYASGERHIAHHTPGYEHVELEAEGIAYTRSALDLPEGLVKFTFVNNDPAGTYHNVGVYSAPPVGTDPKTFVPGKPFVALLPIDGAQKATSTVDTHTVGLDLGTRYEYRCDFHPGMRGTLTVVPAATKSEKGGH